METGTSGLQVRVRDFVRKLRPERVRWQWRHLLASVDNHWPPSTLPCDTPTERRPDSEVEVAKLTAAARARCEQDVADQPMSSLSQLPVASTDEELGRSAASGGDEGGNGGGSVRPNELSLGGGSLVPPSTTPRNKSPVTVQEWVDSLPLTPTEADGQVNRVEEESEPRIVLTQDSDDNLTLGAEAGLMCGPLPPAVQVTSHQEPSESDSHCSSVESLLGARRPDPEEVLLSLGFGGSAASSECRIPQRFLQPSKLKGVAIDDFLRHQQEMVTNFETGFCGYRGLTGPSHTMPSVIVAKIMEKLREHERENYSGASPPPASTNTDRNHNNRFSRAARNVITHLRSPGNSVLTPDNRAWLDSQNQRSPEVSRKRIIIGQQSFTFSRDGDLIESPPSSLTDSDSRWTSSTGTPGHHKGDLSLDKPGFPSIQEAAEPSPPSPTSRLPPNTTVPRHAFANVVTTLLAEKNQESKLSNSSSMEARSVGDSGVGLPSSGRSSRGLDEFDSPLNSAGIDDSAAAATVTVAVELHEANPSPAGETQESVLESCKPDLSNSESEVSRRVKTNSNSSLASEHLFKTPLNSNLKNQDSNGSQSVVENNHEIEPHFDNSVSDLRLCEPSISSDRISNSESDSKVLLGNFSEDFCVSSVHPSLKGADLTPSSTSHCPDLASELENVNMRDEECRGAMEPKREEEYEATTGAMVTSGAGVATSATSTDDVATSATSTDGVAIAPVRVIESLDKVIESLEKIREPLEVFAGNDLQFSLAGRSHSGKEKLLHSFEDLSLLAHQLLEVGVPVEVGSPDHFLSLTVNERCELQCRVVRLALSSYQAQLARDTSHYELKCCLGAEVTRLSDLLDTTSDPDKLSTLVRQMTELLKHQAELTRELAQWTSHSPEEIPGCHQLCEVVLRRLRALELLVHRNTRALSDLRNKVSHS